ncbi:MAG: hypothetical protein KDE15_06705 [Erythrobacter sp.]|nr:hypothetical protein [Erythrobacter sp.]
MHWISITFVAMAALVALLSAHAAWRMRRDAANWVVDLEDGTLCFQSWPEFSLASLSCATCCGVVVFALGF